MGIDYSHPLMIICITITVIGELCLIALGYMKWKGKI